MEIYDLELKLKSYLTKFKIRLCDSPYTINNEQGDELKVLANKLSAEMKCEVSEIEKGLNNLRIKSINNIKSLNKFKQESICSIKVHQPKSVDINLEIQNYNNVSGLDLKQQISKLLFVSDNLIKVIFKGKLIKDDDLLINQGLQNNCKVMVLHINQEDIKDQENCLDFGKNKDMAEYLAKRAIDGRFESDFMNVEIINQSGEVLHLSKNQKSLLTYGLTMHQQAATYMENQQYQMALLHCLEADEAFQKSEYCDSIDNSAILQLDIVWCYYFLQNIDDIPNAKKRLNICEERMKKCYGEGNERIRRIREKKSFEGVPESVHVYRLYLLKAIIAFYENNIGNGRENLLKASEVYKSYVIPGSLITDVMLLGFSRNQAIEGLRVSKDINFCVEYILRREDDKIVLASKREDEAKKSAIVKRLGFTEDKSRINLDVLERLIEQSYMNVRLCLAAVRRANNNFLGAMDLLFTNENQLLKDIKLQQMQGVVVDGDISYEAVIQEKNAINYIQKLVAQDKSIIRQCLRQSDGNIEMTLNTLTDENFNVVNSDSNENANFTSMNNSTPTSSTTVDTIDTSNTVELEQQIYHSVGDGASHTLENQYINPDLTNEILAFNKFARLLNIPEIIHDSNNVAW